jgi:hypothetical protein
MECELLGDALVELGDLHGCVAVAAGTVFSRDRVACAVAVAVDATSCGVLCFGLAFILFLIVCALVFVIEVPLPCVGLLVVVHSEAFACEGREVNCKRRGLCS